MKMEEIRSIAKERGLMAGQMKKTELIRAIQRQEGNSDCFNNGHAASCPEQQCLWRADCR